jgi:hypothetical protein
VLLTAVLVPETALLVPGAAGSADVLFEERSAVLGALRDLVAAGPSRVVVVASAPRSVALTGPLRPSLTAAGIDGGSTWAAPAGDAVEVTDVGPAVALLALAAAGWSGETSVLLVGPEPGALLTATAGLEDLGVPGGRGRREAEHVGLVLVGSLSARRGPGAPLPEDERAPATDDAVLRDLLDLGPEARARLAAFPATLAEELAISAWAPWQVLVSVVDADVRRWRGELRLVSAPLGATCAVIEWRAS